MTDRETEMIDDLFAQVRQKTPDVSDDLLARVLGDAAAVIPTPTAPEPAMRGFWDSLLDLIGGWPSVGGLAMAGVAGVWVGFAPPAAVSTWTAELIGTPVSVDLLGGTGDVFEESLIDG